MSGDQICVLLANDDNRNIWYINQCAKAQYYDDCVVVTSEQARSTPGLKASLQLKANQRFHLRTYGQSIRQACAFVWVYLLSNQRRLVPNYTMLPADDSGESCIDIEFSTPTSQKSHLQVFIGVLFTGPPKCGDQFKLSKMELTYMQECAFPTQAVPLPPPSLSAPSFSAPSFSAPSFSAPSYPPPLPGVPPPPDCPNRADPYYDCYDTNGNSTSAATACDASPCIALQSSGYGASAGVPVSLNELSSVCDTIISNLDAGGGGGGGGGGGA